MTVDDFVEAKVLPEFWPVVSVLRELLCEAAADVEELVYYGQPIYRRNNLVFAWLTPSKKGITLSFRQGKALEDKYGLLKGNAKWSR